MNSDEYLIELSKNGVKDYQEIVDTNNIPRYQISSSKQIRVVRMSERCKNGYIPLHRHTYYEILVVTKSKPNKHSHEIDFISYPFVEGNIYFIYPNQTHKWNIEDYDGEFDGYILNFNESFLLENSSNIKLLLDKLFNPYENIPFLNYKENELEDFFSVLSIFEKEYIKKDQNKKILRALLETLLYYIGELEVDSSKELDSSYQKLHTLRNLIEENYKEEKNSEYYARAMELSSKRLNEIVKKVSGYTVTQLIHNRLLLEAKREMVSQVKTIYQISIDLGFNNPSYFARFFKKYEGVSPKDYSKQMFK